MKLLTFESMQSRSSMINSCDCFENFLVYRSFMQDSHMLCNLITIMRLMFSIILVSRFRLLRSKCLVRQYYNLRILLLYLEA